MPEPPLEVRRQPGGLWAAVHTATGQVVQLYTEQRDAARRVQSDNTAAAEYAAYRQRYTVQPPLTPETLTWLEAKNVCECECPASLALPGAIAEIRRLQALMASA